MPDPGPVRIASFPPAIKQNPYQRLLYASLARHGFEGVAQPRFGLRWLWKNRQRVEVLHFHWPHPYYRHTRGPARLRRPLSWIRLGLFAARLLAARRLGYRVVWTVHELAPHETHSRRLDSTAAALLAAASRSLIVHDRFTRDSVAAALPSAASKIEIVSHGSYIGVYPAGRGRAAVRRELGIAPDAFVFLCFGHVRGYKNLDILLDAFERLPAANAVLVVAGLPLDERAAGLVGRAASRDDRVKSLLQFVPETRVAELFGASDVAVLPRSDGGTSGALVLALSLGLPVIASRRPAYTELTADGLAGWHFQPESTQSLLDTMDAVMSDRAGLESKARAALARARALRWEDTAARTASVIRKGRAGDARRRPVEPR
jgi:glycosyltransferase involved in cell wall biosynthesis